MNVKRFAARTSREAFALVRQAFGEDAVVLSTRPCPEGVEVLAMAPEAVDHLEKVAQPGASAAAAAAGRPLAQRAERRAAEQQLAQRQADRSAGRSVAPPSHQPDGSDVDQDVQQLAMSTLSFQDYVRERMLRRRQALMNGERGNGERGADLAPPALDELPEPAPRAASRATGPVMAQPVPPAPPRQPRMEPMLDDEPAPTALRAGSAAAAAAAPLSTHPAKLAGSHPAQTASLAAAQPHPQAAARRSLPRRLDDGPSQFPERNERALPALQEAPLSNREQLEMIHELRAMKGLIEERFGAMAFMEKLQRDPRQGSLAQKLMDAGFSPGLVRKMVDALPAEAADEMVWAQQVLERNLSTGEAEAPLEEQGGVFALIGSTGVGKTTTTAKLAAAFATAYGPGQLGLITLDAYRVGAHEQLRAYGRILGVPVHTAHDRASLEDLLDLLSAKKMVLIDTAGMAQRDSRTKELLEMLSHRSVQRLLVLDASVQGETLDEVIQAWKAPLCRGVILSKIDEAVKLAPALDAVIRHRLKVLGAATGQRVPEDWHRLTANALLQRALRGGGGATFRVEAADVQLLFAQRTGVPAAPGTLHH